MSWTECKLPGVPGEAAAMIRVSKPGKLFPGGRTFQDVSIDPSGRFDINEYLNGAGGVCCGQVTKDSYGVYMAHIPHKLGTGSFIIGSGRITRAQMALRIASRLAGETIQRDNMNGWTGEAQGCAWTGGVAVAA